MDIARKQNRYYENKLEVYRANYSTVENADTKKYSDNKDFIIF